MVLLGCTPDGRNIEQHDIFFGIADSLKGLIPQMNAFWPEANGNLHIDSWREVKSVDGHLISIVPEAKADSGKKLYFVNLGGYKENDFEEYHYKLLSVADSISDAVKESKKTAFFKHYNLPGKGASHIDDKFGIDVDDIHNVSDILAADLRSQYSIVISPEENIPEDELHIGYVRLNQL